MTALITSNMQRVLEIPELLDMIFRFLDDASNACNARVCKKWSDMALDTMWRDVNDLHRLFSLLSPMRKTIENEYTFHRLPDSGDWQHFEHYRRRIRRLSYNAEGVTHTLHQSVFDDIARTRTSLDILPSMHTLEWNAPLPLCVMFMHSNVKRFSVHLPDVLQNISPGPFFLDIAVRMPNITHLDLRMNLAMHCIEAETDTLLSSLTKLQRLTLPRFTFTTKIAESVSRLEHLETVEFQYHEVQGRGNREDILEFSPSLAAGAFPSLWDLSTTISFRDAAHFLEVPFAPTNLTTLYLDSQMIETPEDIHYLCTVLADSCQRLKALALISFVDASIIPGQAPEKDVCISIDTLTPLLGCPNLVSLEITHHYPLYLQQEDVEKIAIKWPTLETLLLNNEPAYTDQPTLTLHALLPFSRHCPNLRHLGLFVYASTVDLSSCQLESSSAHQYPVFRSLKRLSMGVSPITEEGPVALFLSQICPLYCQLDCGVTWDSSIEIAGATAAKIHARYTKWSKVVELLPLLIKLRMDEKERTRMLQAEVEDLRVRTGILMDKASVGTGDTCIMA